tara:strand:+ start:4761 stop:5363 length:603 start_codon:yes stop_codon:yes gene_type:complete
MKVTVDGKRATVKLGKDVPLSITNAIRRTLLLDLPAVAPSIFTIEKNSSPFPCETLAHRIGLCPVIANTKESQRFSLTAIGPGSVFSDAVVKIDDYDENSNTNAQPDEEMLSPGIYLFSLAANQEVRLRGECRLGTGRVNARFQTTCAVSLSTAPDGGSVLSFESISSSVPVEEALCQSLVILRLRLREVVIGLESLRSR